MARKPITSMAYSSGEEMMFGTAKHPVTTKRGIEIGGGFVHPEVVPHPRPGSEKTKKTLLPGIWKRPTGTLWREWSSWAIPPSKLKTSTSFR